MNQFLVILCLLFISCAKPSAHEEQIKDEGKEESSLHPNKKFNSFIYHRFGDDRYPSTNISIPDFKAQLEYLKTEKFQLMNFSDAINYLKEDGHVQKVVVITIDDGFKSFYENGLPLLEEYGFPATLFINTETVGGATYMNWEELKDAQKRGIEIGNHTHSHAFFLDQPAAERYDHFRSEISKCQELINKHLGTKPRIFAYPYGEFDEQMKTIVKESGFIAAAAQNSGVTYSGTDLMACPRFPMAASFSNLEDFKLKANTFPLKVSGSPTDHTIAENYSPELQLTLNQTGIRTNEIQCFIQGGNCDLKVNKISGGKYELHVKNKASLANRRRTLYTLTAQDSVNQWHWYSYLWINPKVKE